MLVLGLILVLLALALFAGVIMGGADDSARFDVGFLDATLSTLSVFLLGALVMLLLVLGIALMRSGARRASQRRKDSKELGRLNKKLAKQEEKTHEQDLELEERRRADETSTPPSNTV